MFIRVKPLFPGVPQGSVRGLLLFVIFINDIVLELNKPKIIKYADDTVVFLAYTDCYKVEIA